MTLGEGEKVPPAPWSFHRMEVIQPSLSLATALESVTGIPSSTDRSAPASTVGKVFTRTRNESLACPAWWSVTVNVRVTTPPKPGAVYVV